MRYYVARSSWFDTHPYNKTRIKSVIVSAIIRAGGTNIRESIAPGWRNQYNKAWIKSATVRAGGTNPAVVTFSASSRKVAKVVESSVSKALRTQWVVVREKDW